MQRVRKVIRIMALGVVAGTAWAVLGSAPASAGEEEAATCAPDISGRVCVTASNYYTQKKCTSESGCNTCESAQSYICSHGNIDVPNARD
jgi:hypothetical protein